MKRPKVLLLIPNLGRGGAQRVFYQHRQFLEKEYDVSCCVFNFDGAFEQETHDNILSLDVPAGRNFFEKGYFFFQRIKRLKRLKRQLGVEITVSHLEGADYVNILSRGQDKAILWIHGSKLHDRDIKGGLGWLRMKFLLPFLYRRADRIVCVSEGIREELLHLVRNMSKKFFVVRNGIDVDTIREKSRSLPVEWEPIFRENKVVITHCRFVPQKNLEAFISIVDKLKSKQGLKWVIAGDGKLRESLFSLCRDEGISYYNSWDPQPLSTDYTIYFIGHQENPFPFLAASTLYLLTSLWEGFPLAICEALACGLPVAATDCYTGPREILAPGKSTPVAVPTEAEFGILLPVEGDFANVDTWSDQIVKLLNNDGKLKYYRMKASIATENISIERAQRETIAEVKALSK